MHGAAGARALHRLASHDSPLTSQTAGLLRPLTNAASSHSARRGLLAVRGLASQSGPYDVAVIGGGPGGYVAAVKASQLGYKVSFFLDVTNIRPSALRSAAPSAEPA